MRRGGRPPELTYEQVAAAFLLGQTPKRMEQTLRTASGRQASKRTIQRYLRRVAGDYATVMWALFEDECRKHEVGREFLGSLPKPEAQIKLGRGLLKKPYLDHQSRTVRHGGFFLISPVPGGDPTNHTLLLCVDNSKVRLSGKNRRPKS